MYPPTSYVLPAQPAYAYPPYYPYAPAPVPSAPLPPYGPYHQPIGTGFPHHVPQPTSSPTKVSHNVSLDEFCIKYGISDSDKQKLDTLKYKPGHPGVERFKEREWQEYGKFLRLGWETFLEPHFDFCKKLKSGQT